MAKPPPPPHHGTGNSRSYGKDYQEFHLLILNQFDAPPQVSLYVKGKEGAASAGPGPLPRLGARGSPSSAMVAASGRSCRRFGC